MSLRVYRLKAEFLIRTEMPEEEAEAINEMLQEFGCRETDVYIESEVDYTEEEEI